MSSFTRGLDALVAQLDPEAHADEIQVLRRCRSLRDLDRVADAGGWLTGPGPPERLKLIKHRSGTYLVVRYEEGWSTRLAIQEFARR